MMAVTNKISNFDYQNPLILNWLFDEEEETRIEDVKTEKIVIKNFELRKLDTKYLKMIHEH